MKGLYIGDTWEQFLAQRERLPSWKIPLSIATALHLLVFTGAAVLPDIGKRYEPDKVITIDLLSLPPAAPAPPAGQQGQPGTKENKENGKEQRVEPAQVKKEAQPQKTQKVVHEAVRKKVVQKAKPAVEPVPPEPSEQVSDLPVVVPKKVVQKPVQKTVQQPAALPEPVAQTAHTRPISLNPL
ncbi:MAG: hypothetical protein D3906_03715, partial [Candidatus Electrothrix sp. AUS1_2]|nr:hypothetical protein [Candidatus Electrothrix sp. AUS1_2]